MNNERLQYIATPSPLPLQRGEGKESRIKKFLSIFLCFFLTFSLISTSVEAATSAFAITTCNTDGTVSNPTTDSSTGFFDVTKVVNNCSSLDSTKIFSNIVCNFASIVNQVMGASYCGLQHGLLPVVTVILTIYIAVFGAQVLMGMVAISAGEIMMRLVKIAAVWSFASYGAWGIGLLYKFFIGFTLQGINWMLSSITFCVINSACDTSKPTTTDTVFSQIDSQINAVIAGIGSGAGSIGGLFGGKQELVSFFVSGLAIIAAPLFIAGIGLFWMAVKMFAKTVLSFLMGIAAIAFLIALSPIFLTCVLFKTTKKMFDSWISYMVSYSLQPVLSFAILALWLTVTAQFMGFMTEISNVVVLGKGQLQTVGNIAQPYTGILFCPIEYSTGKNGPSIQCAGGVDKTSFIDAEQLKQPTTLTNDSKFLYFISYHLITLLIIGYAFSNILDQASKISQMLAGSQTAMSLSAAAGSFGSGVAEIKNMIPSGGGGKKSGGLGDMAKKVSNMATRRNKK